MRFIYVFFGVITLISCNKDLQNNNSQVKAVIWTKVKTTYLPIQHQFPGNITAAIKSRLSFELAGELISVQVKEGQVVKRGELIARLNPASYELELKRQQSLLTKAKVSLTQAENDYQRNFNLFEQKLISTQSLDDTETMYLLRQTEVETIRALINLTIDSIDKTQLFAPFDGLISASYIENNEHVKLGEKVVKLEGVQQLEVEFWLPDNLSSVVGIGTEITLRTMNRSNDMVGELFSATVSEYRSTDDEVAAILVTAKVKNDPDKINTIKSGDTVQVIYSNDYLAHSNSLSSTKLSLPLTALLIENNNKYSIYKVDSSTSQVEKLPVREVVIYDSHASFAAAIGNGDIIVAAGVTHLVEGQKVHLLSEIRH